MAPTITDPISPATATTTTVDDPELYNVFMRYVQFGASRGSSLPATPPPASTTKAIGHADVTTPLLEGSKFAKLVREAGLLEGSHPLNLTTVDIIFAQVKDRSERRLNFLQFRMALKLLAEKKYPRREKLVDGAKDSDAILDSEEEIIKAIRNIQRPQFTAITHPENSETINRLMDAPDGYISRTPPGGLAEGRSWKDNLRRQSNSNASISANNNNGSMSGESRRSSLLTTGGSPVAGTLPSSPSSGIRHGSLPNHRPPNYYTSSPTSRRFLPDP